MDSPTLKGQRRKRLFFAGTCCADHEPTNGFSTHSKYIRNARITLHRVQVSAPTAAGWCSPEEAAAALASPPTTQDTLSSPASSSSSLLEPLPPSAMGLVLTLMRCNPCEVLGSLSPGIGTDGRVALIGRVDNSGAGRPTSAVGTAGGKTDDGGVACSGSKILLRERHHRDGGGIEVHHDDGVNGRDTFRCSLEVAWDKDVGGVFVQRFGMEPNERKSR